MTYTSRRPPRQKQAEALDAVTGKKAFALLMAMRTGKTKVVLDDWARLVDREETSDLLVVAPAGVYRTWEGEIEKDLNLAHVMVGVWKSGSKNAELPALMNHRGPRIFLVNVEALSTVKAAKEACVEFLSRGSGMIAVDESTTIRNIRAKRTRFIINTLKPLSKYRRILSGLVAPRSPLDLYGQFYFLDPSILGHTNYYSYRATYAIMKQIVVGGRAIQVPVGWRNEKDLRRRIAPYSFRVRLEDCYDLPPSDYSIRDVAMTSEQQRIYREMKEHATALLEGQSHVTASQVMVQVLRLHQILCGHTRDEHDALHNIPENKTKELLELLDDYDGKAIIWCAYDHDVRHVAARLAKKFDPILAETHAEPEWPCDSVARFWGGNLNTREEEEIRFKLDPGCRFMVATAAAGGRGRTWDMADLVVYYSSDSDLEHRSQSEERPKNVNKTTAISYVDLICRGTVEEKILRALRAKIDLSSTINGDEWREWVI